MRVLTSAYLSAVTFRDYDDAVRSLRYAGWGVLRMCYVTTFQSSPIVIRGLPATVSSTLSWPDVVYRLGYVREVAT